MQNVGDPNEPIDSASLDGLRGVLLAEQQERREVARQIVDELTSLEGR